MRMFRLWFLVLGHVLMSAGLTNGSSILAFFPMPVRSHHSAFQPLVQGLLDRGHSVTYLTPFPMNPTSTNNQNYTEILIKDYMDEVKNIMSKRLGVQQNDEVTMLLGMPFQQQLMLIMARQYGLVLGEHTLQDPGFRTLISSDSQFDCVLYSGSFMQEIYSALSHRFQAHLIEVHPAGNMHFAYWMHGNPYDTSYIVDFSVASGDRMSLLERIENTFNSLLLRSVWYLYFLPKYQQLMNEQFRYPGWETRPSLLEMIGNTSMVLINTHYSLNYPYPLSPNFKEIGGINLRQSPSLPQDLQEFMDSATEGVVYFTLGSHINVSTTMAGPLKQAFAAAFSRIKQKVLWKWEQGFPDLPANVKISKWFPQQAILSHKNCKLFITHGGFLSLTEAVYYGVPMIGIPLLADQMKNVHHMQLNGYGLLLNFRNLTLQSISWALDEVFSNPKYRKNIEKQSELYRDKPETALETAVYWIEYVIRHKGAHHLRPAIATMPWYQQAMIDVYAAIAAAVIIPLYALYKCLKCIFRCVCCKQKSDVQNKRKVE